jgi:hypothetical protein
MFIVAMTLAVIAAMGIYALQLAATEVKTAGFVRQQAQTQYLAEYGVVASAQALTGTGAQVYNNIMMLSPDTGCYSLFGITSTGGANSQSLACHRAGSVELQAEIGGSTALSPLLSPWVDALSDADRGSIGLQMTPDFYVEVTDPNQRQPPPGFATNSTLCFTQFTASAIAITPTAATSTISEGLQIARARVVGGPITCSGTN